MPTAASVPGQTSVDGLVTLEDAIARAKGNEPAFAAAIAAQKVAVLDHSLARSALLPSVISHNEYLYTQPAHGPTQSGNASTAGVSRSPRFIANNAVHEYTSQGVVIETIGVQQFTALAQTSAAQAIASADLEIARRGLVSTVVGLYYTALTARHKAAIADRALDEAMSFTRLALQREVAREAAHADVVKARLEQQQREREYADAKLTSERAQLDLAVLLFPDPHTRYMLKDFGDASGLPARADVEAAASQNNAELKSALASMQAANARVGAARAAYLPDLGLSFNYGIDAEEFAVHGPNGVRNLGYSASATVDVPVWNWFATRDRIKQTVALRDSAKITLSATQRRLIADLDEFYGEASVAHDQIRLLEESSATARESLRLSRLRYSSGESTVLEVVDAQNALTQTEVSYEDGVLRYQTALANLQLLTGDNVSMPVKRHPRRSTHLLAGHVSDCLRLVALSTILAGCQKPETTPTPLVTVQTVHPHRGEIAGVVTADATLSPLAQAAISSRVTAPIKRFLVQRGERVHIGELLATLENSDLSAAALENGGTYAAAKASYELSTLATVPEDYSKAQLDLTQARANLDLSGSIVSSRTQLFAEGAIPGRDLDTAKAAFVQAQAAYDIAKQHFAAVQKTSNKASLESAKGQLESARGKYLGAQAMLSYTEIRSPIDGVVTERPLFAGETATAGVSLITVIDTSALIAKVHLAQSQAQQLAVGAAAELSMAGIEAPAAAKLSLISPALDPGSTTVEVWVRAENPKNSFKAGAPVRASISGPIIKSALLLPIEALQTGEDGSKFVMAMATDGTAHKHAVTTGVQSDGEVQIVSGITAEDAVITTGAYGLEEGTRVTVEAAKAVRPDAAKSAGAGDDK